MTDETRTAVMLKRMKKIDDIRSSVSFDINEKNSSLILDILLEERKYVATKMSKFPVDSAPFVLLEESLDYINDQIREFLLLNHDKGDAD